MDSGLHNGTFNFTYLEKNDIKNILNHERPLINWVFERLTGLTIATEPKHCGGLLKSNKFLNMISESYFTPELFAPSCNWKWKPVELF